MVFTSVNNAGAVRMIKSIMPNSKIIYRPVFGTGDPNPRTEHGYWRGEDWGKRMWPAMAGAEADYYQFTNEWQGNGDPPASVQGFNDFYIQLGEWCLKQRIVCTFGDWSVGTPGYPTIAREAHYLPILQGMLTWADQHGFPVNYHKYAPQGEGANNMAAQKELYFMRDEQLCKGHPRLKIIGGEGSNAGKDSAGVERGIFRPETLSLMKQACDLIRASPYRANYLGVCWWWFGDGNTHRGGEANWAIDDFSSISQQFFEFVATY